MAARLLAVGSYPLVRTDDGRLISWKGRHSFKTFIAQPDRPLRITHRQTDSFVHDLVENWGYSPFFDSDGTLGVTLPSNFLDSYPAWETIHLPGGRSVAAFLGLASTDEDEPTDTLDSWLDRASPASDSSLFALCCPSLAGMV